MRLPAKKTHTYYRYAAIFFAALFFISAVEMTLVLQFSASQMKNTETQNTKNSMQQAAELVDKQLQTMQQDIALRISMQIDYRPTRVEQGGIYDIIESLEDAALQMLNSIFGVVQFSQIIEAMPESHVRMTGFWLDFSRKNEDALLHGAFIPQEPQFLYPVIRAQNAQTAIIGIYAKDRIVEVDAARPHLKLINATPKEAVYLRFSVPCNEYLTVRNAMGDTVRTERMTFRPGVTAVPVPRCGLAELDFRT